MQTAGITEMGNDTSLIAICAPDDLTHGLSREWQAIGNDTQWQTFVGRSLDAVSAGLRQRA